MDNSLVTFRSGDWNYVVQICEEVLKMQRSLLENPNTSYKEKLIAIGHIANAKKILNLPSIAPQNKG